MTDPIIDDLKQKVDIVELVGHYVTLKKSGANYKAPCPFHPEKTPSFMVNSERQLFRCFGCGESGDIFAFLMKQENIDFPSALKLLASKAGVTLPEKTGNGRLASSSNKQDLYKVNDIAARFFHQVLVSHPLGKAAFEYLEKRGVTRESMNQFQIGYAPQTTTAIQSLLTKNAVSPSLSRQAGSPERFRNRIMFPFRDVIGNVVGFSGRALGDQMPKYLNTSETEIFRKNRYLYGLFEGKKAIGQMGKIIMVEGQLDLVLAHQAGTSCTVATSGTALTNDHLTILRRYSDTLHIAFDGDTAGQKAIERAIQLALPHGFDVRAIPIPEGSDPGEMIAKDPKKWLSALEKTQPALSWLFSYNFPSTDKKLSTTERNKAFDMLFPYIETQKDTVDQSKSLQHLGLLLGITQEKVVNDAFETWKSKNASSPEGRQEDKNNTPGESVKSNESNAQLDDLTRRERSLVGLVIIHPALLEYKNFHLQAEDFTHPSLAKLYKTIRDWYNKNTIKSSSSLIEYVFSTLPSAGQQALQKLIFDTQTNTADFSPEEYLQEYSRLVSIIRQRLREDRIQNFASLLARAEADNDRSRVIEIMKQIEQISKSDTIKQKELHAQENS